METLILIFCAAFLVGLSLSMETVGVLGRHVGVVLKSPAYGYSIHNRIATIGRVFVFLGFPIIGYIIDTTNDPSHIFLTGILICCVHTFIGLIFFFCHNLIYSRIHTYTGANTVVISIRNLDFTIVLFSAAAIFLQLVGIVVVNSLAAMHADLRATLLQTAPALTALGTVLHTFIADPRLSKLSDSSATDSVIGTSSYIVGRVVGLLSLLFTLLIVTNLW